jgi:hypothetical protein
MGRASWLGGGFSSGKVRAYAGGPHTEIIINMTRSPRKECLWGSCRRPRTKAYGSAASMCPFAVSLRLGAVSLQLLSLNSNRFGVVALAARAQCSLQPPYLPLFPSTASPPPPPPCSPFLSMRVCRRRARRGGGGGGAAVGPQAQGSGRAGGAGEAAAAAGGDRRGARVQASRR